MMLRTIFILFSALVGTCTSSSAQTFSIKNNPQVQTVSFGNDKLKMILNYNHQCRVSYMEVNGQKVIDGSSGIYSEIESANQTFSTLHLAVSPKVTVTRNTVEVSNIRYGSGNILLQERWLFLLSDTGVKFSITRNCPKSFEAQSVSFPAVEFDNMNTWEGAFQGFGGIAWFYLFNEKLCTYGVHTNEASFWNSKTNNGLNITTSAPGKQVAMKYSRTNKDKLGYSISLSEKELQPRYDSGTHRRRFIRKKTDVWNNFKMVAGVTSQIIDFSFFDYAKTYGRGEFKGVDGDQVTSVLNTIARIGVIDAKHFGGNSWHTPYGPICLHEQYIAQMGLGINDARYLDGYKQCLDYYRDNAIRPDGRVWPRWAYTNEDAMPGQFTDKGFYEAQWGYLMDSNTDFVTNVSELYDQTGDKAWVKKQQLACEKALEFLLKRDSNGNHLVEMMNDNHTEKKSSDWIDIIWASYENAFVNAKLYRALQLWSGIEKQLGNAGKATYYADFAAKLKETFNKSIHDGGFWDEEKGYYIYWRDKDQSTHGDNLVTPVNFMAIAYGICDDTLRRNTILDQLEAQMQKEHLFFWPISMFPYKNDEGKDYQFPFPYYENGDIFLSWGSVAVKAYASYKPELALKYVNNILKQYSIDGLAFQRYSRKKQDGQGDDILAGNSLPVVGLYQAVFGFNPLYNRFYLNPHITEEISGSRLYYHYRGNRLTIGLNTGNYSISNKLFAIGAANDFGFFSTGNKAQYFHKSSDVFAIQAQLPDAKHLDLFITECTEGEMKWNQITEDKTGKIKYTLNQLKPGSSYSIYTDGQLIKKMKSDANGRLIFDVSGKSRKIKISLQK